MSGVICSSSSVVNHHNASYAKGNKPPGVPTQADVASQDWNVRAWKLSSNTAEQDAQMEK